jgi:hypothetical protein
VLLDTIIPLLESKQKSLFEDNMNLALEFKDLPDEFNFMKGELREKIVAELHENITENATTMFDLEVDGNQIEIKSSFIFSSNLTKNGTYKTEISIHKLKNRKSKLESAQKRPIDLYIIFAGGFCKKTDKFYMSISVYDPEVIVANTVDVGFGCGINIDVVSGAIMIKESESKRSRWIVSDHKPLWTTLKIVDKASSLVKERVGSQIVKEECERAKKNVLERIRNRTDKKVVEKKRGKMIQKCLHFFS